MAVRISRGEIGRVVGVMERRRQRPAAGRRIAHRQKSVQIIKLFARGHPRGAAGAEGNLADQGRVRKIAVTRVVIAIGHAREA